MNYKYFIIATWLGLFSGGYLNASNVVVAAQTTLIDGKLAPYNQLTPGDTIFLQAGLWDNLVIRNFKGIAGKPFIFINKGGIATFSTDHNHGISIQNCQFFRLTGTGTKSVFYGIQISNVENGTGIGVGGLSSNYEIDHISIKNVPIAGIYAKTDPDCSGNTTREFFTQFNTSIHDNYIENAGNEGLYIGSTKYFGQTIKCNDKDTILLPSALEGVKVYNNIIRNSGWDGIQVSSATKDCSVYGNRIYNDSQAEVPSQMSGIIIGGGSKCDCYNNYIADGKGVGVEIHGIGGNRIFNNIIVNPGMSYYPGNFESTKMKHGIFVSDVSTQKDSSFFILNNTIVNPKSDGIRFSSTVSKKNLIASNVIINPGNFDYYENGNFRAKGVDSYVMLTDLNSEVKLSNNFFSRDLSSAILDQSYKPQVGSPLIDNGYAGEPKVLFDFDLIVRPQGNGVEIGAFEYQSITATFDFLDSSFSADLYPNPANSYIIIRLKTASTSALTIHLYNEKGENVFSLKEDLNVTGGREIFQKLPMLPTGIYVCQIMQGKRSITRKFICKQQ